MSETQRNLSRAIDRVRAARGVRPLEIRLDALAGGIIAHVKNEDGDVLLLHPATLGDLLAGIPDAPEPMALLYQMHYSSKPILHYQGIPVFATNVSAYLAGEE